MKVSRSVYLEGIRRGSEENKKESLNEFSEEPDESSVLVIVELNLLFTPEGNLDKEEREIQRQKIYSAQEDLIKKLQGHKFSVVKKFDTIPSLTLSADEKTLIFLKTLPEVKSVHEDRPVGF